MVLGNIYIYITYIYDIYIHYKANKGLIINRSKNTPKRQDVVGNP